MVIYTKGTKCFSRAFKSPDPLKIWFSKHREIVALQLERPGWAIHDCRVQRQLSHLGSTAWNPSWRATPLTFQIKYDGIPYDHPWDTRPPKKKSKLREKEREKEKRPCFTWEHLASSSPSKRIWGLQWVTNGMWVSNVLLLWKRHTTN